LSRNATELRDVDVQISIVRLVRRAVIDVDQFLSRKGIEIKTHSAVCIGAMINTGVITLQGGESVERPSSVGEGVGIRVIGMRGLCMPDENAVACHQPFSLADVGSGIATTGDEVQPTGLHIGDGGIREQVPALSQPDGGEIALGEVKGRSVVVEVRDRARAEGVGGIAGIVVGRTVAIWGEA